LGKCKSQHLVDTVKNTSGVGKILIKVLTHANILRALTGKENCVHII
jgi:hypothetical protein